MDLRNDERKEKRCLDARVGEVRHGSLKGSESLRTMRFFVVVKVGQKAPRTRSREVLVGIRVSVACESCLALDSRYCVHVRH